MNRLTYFVVLLFMFLHSCPRGISAKKLFNYSYVIDSAGQAFEGYVDSTGKSGDRVPVIKTEDKEFIENGTEIAYLQVVMRKKIKSKRETVLTPVDTDEFAVDKDWYIVVNNTKKFDRTFTKEFYVVMLAGDDVVSNPVPFVVRFEMLAAETSSSYNKTAAVFAGVLVCLIVVFALVIPFGVRAKRRLRSGKPVFKLGSHPESIPNLNNAVDNEKGSQTKLTTHMQVDNEQHIHPHAHIFARTVTEGDFYDNRGYRLEETFEREQNELTKDLLKIANHVQEPDNGIFIQLEKKDSSDLNSSLSSKSKRKGILKNGTPAKYTVEIDEMDKKATSSKHEHNQKEETSHL